MNIAAWEKALADANLEKEYAEVVEGFQVGFNQGIPPHNIGDLRWYAPPNPQSAFMAREKIE